jgi:hypothetical protein
MIIVSMNDVLTDAYQIVQTYRCQMELEFEDFLCIVNNDNAYIYCDAEKKYFTWNSQAVEYLSKIPLHDIVFKSKTPITHPMVVKNIFAYMEQKGFAHIKYHYQI